MTSVPSLNFKYVFQNATTGEIHNTGVLYVVENQKKGI